MNIERRNSKQANWFKHIAGWEQSGKSQRQYCLGNNLSVVQFGYWRKRFLKHHHENNNPQSRLINITKSSINNQQFIGDIKLKTPMSKELYLPASLPLPQLLPILKFLGFGHDCA